MNELAVGLFAACWNIYDTTTWSSEAMKVKMCTQCAESGKRTQTISEEVNQSSNYVRCVLSVLFCHVHLLLLVIRTLTWRLIDNLRSHFTQRWKRKQFHQLYRHSRILDIFFCQFVDFHRIICIFWFCVAEFATDGDQRTSYHPLNGQLEALRNWKLFDRFSFPFFTLQLMTELKTGLMKFHYYSNVCVCVHEKRHKVEVIYSYTSDVESQPATDRRTYGQRTGIRTLDVAHIYFFRFKSTS